MKLTEKQMTLINRAKELENEYGKGNVFIRWINDYWRAVFVVHKAGEEIYSPKLIDENRVNATIFNALESKGLTEFMDTSHIKRDPNMWRSEKFIGVGSRIKTELI